MFELLSWLYSQYQKVYLWFGNTFYTAYNNALNMMNWIITYATNAYNNAKTYAYNLFLDFRSDLSGFIDWVNWQIKSLQSNILEDVTGLRDWIEWKLSTITGLIQPIVTNSLQSLYNFIIGVPDAIRNWVRDRIAETSQFINSQLDWIHSLKQWLLYVSQALSIPSLSDLLATFNRIKSAVLPFLDNPLIFILDIIQPLFVSFLCYVIAWSLGTVESDLPKNAPWRK